MSQIIGHISQVIGPVVDVYFEGTDAEMVLPSKIGRASCRERV